MLNNWLFECYVYSSERKGQWVNVRGSYQTMREENGQRAVKYIPMSLSIYDKDNKCPPITENMVIIGQGAIDARAYQGKDGKFYATIDVKVFSPYGLYIGSIDRKPQMAVEKKEQRTYTATDTSNMDAYSDGIPF